MYKKIKEVLNENIMTGPTNPIDPFEHVRVERVEEKHAENKKKQKLVPKQVSKKLFLYLTFIKLLKDTINTFTSNHKKHRINDTPLKKEILTFKAALNSLKAKDLSQDSKFLNYFAFIWLKLLKNLEIYSIEPEKLENEIKAFIHLLQIYPQSSEFSLGYYLSEFAGFKWVPFPYMEMLQKLHFEHKKDPDNSTLQKWTDILDKI